MEYCSYNEILNKIYNIVKSNDRLLRLLLYKEDVDIDDYEKYPKMTSTQKRETASKYIKKMSNIKAVNNEVGCYLNLKYRIVDFSDTKKRGSYNPYWSRAMFDIVISCSESIESLQDASRILEVIGELQNSLSMKEVDGVGNSVICGFSESNTVEGYNSYTISITFYDKNESVM